mgnify:CR=1 FL=1
MPSPAPDGFTVARVTIDADLWTDVRIAAMRRRQPMSDVVADALADWLVRQDGSGQLPAEQRRSA